MVVHLACTGDEESGPKVGFVVGRSVGGAVVRHRVQRQLRHLMRARLDRLPRGALVVVRALPAAAGTRSARLGEDLDAALRRLSCTPSGALAAGSRSPGHLVGSPSGGRP